MSTVPAAPPVPAPDPVDPATIATWPAHRAEVAARLVPALGTAPTQRRALAYLCFRGGADPEQVSVVVPQQLLDYVHQSVAVGPGHEQA